MKHNFPLTAVSEYDMFSTFNTNIAYHVGFFPTQWAYVRIACDNPAVSHIND